MKTLSRDRLVVGAIGMVMPPVLIAGCQAEQSEPETAETIISETSSEGPWQAYEDYLAGLAATGEFSGVVAVAEGDDTVMEVAHGMADREGEVANTPETTFCVASVGKMFTAVAIAQLVESGDLTFDTTIATYLDSLPDEIANRVTIDQLLTHTSGMGNVALGRVPGRPAPPTSLEGMMARIATAPLQAEPGAQHMYSNDGFIVLGAIIESVTGQSYAEYVSEHVFESAGMAGTGVAPHCPADVPGAALGYVDGSSRPGGVGDIGNPSGGAFSTAGDMLRFAEALMSHELLSPEMTEKVLAGKVDTGRPSPGRDQYAYGFSDREIGGVRIVGHSGGNPEYEAQLDIYPDEDYAVVVLANQGETARPAIRWLEDELTTG